MADKNLLGAGGDQTDKQTLRFCVLGSFKRALTVRSFATIACRTALSYRVLNEGSHPKLNN